MLSDDDKRDIHYLRSVLAKVSENTDFAIYVKPEDWAKYLTWALDLLEEEEPTTETPQLSPAESP
jgi:hypothetical protein